MARRTSVNKYLRMAGIRSGEDDMTEAQITERNKSNPLGSFGYRTAQERMQEMAMRNAERRAMEEEAMMQEQIMLQQAAPERAIGHYAGKWAAQGLGKILGKGKPAPAPEAPPQNDPEVDRYNQLVQELGSEASALEMLGQETGTASMLTQAQELRKADEERKLDMDYKKHQMRKQPNEVISIQKTGPNGEPMLTSAEIYGVDPETGMNLYREVGAAAKGQTTASSVEDWKPTGSQKGSALQDFEGAMTNTENYLDTSDRIIEIAEKAPSGPGWASKLASSSNNLVMGWSGLRDIVGKDQIDNKTKAKLAASNPASQYKDVFARIGGVAKEDAKLQALLLEQAYMMATANGQRATDPDIVNALTTLGASLNDKEAFMGVISQNREMYVDRLFNMAKNTGGDGKTLGDVYGERLGGIKARRNPGMQDTTEDEQARKRLEELRAKHKGKK
jgi:hypothetical protein